MNLFVYYLNFHERWVSEMAKLRKVSKVSAPEVKTTSEEKEAAVVEAVKEEAVKAETVTETVSETKAEKKPAAKKPAEKKAEPEKSANLFIQYCGKQFSEEEIIEKAKNAAVEEAGLKRASSIKTIDIYCKPEEHAAYYVANGGKVVGRIDL
jgi:FtsZ-interacting cell division protein ZipA